MNIIQWLDGKKTIIATVLGWLALNMTGLFNELGMGDATWLPVVVKILNWAASVMIPVGLADKVRKARTAPPPSPDGLPPERD
jgi:hypothetical protein